MYVPVIKQSSFIHGTRNCDLLDIGKFMDNLDPVSNEAKFYNDQKGRRYFRVQSEVNFDSKEYIAAEIDNAKMLELSFNTETDFTFDDSIEVIPEIVNRKILCPCVSIVKLDKGIQANINIKPEIRSVRNFEERIKDTIASVSSRGAISVPKARVVTQVVCDKFYSHDYKLEAPEIDTGEPINKKPRSADDYERYKDVLPSSKVVSSYKHSKALCQEIVAAKMMMNKEVGSKLILHYDTTSRSRVDGEWPSIILNFSGPKPENCQMIPLRPIFFAYETIEQITCLIVETLKRLLASLGEDNMTLDDMWRKIDAVMTDAARKNLKIETAVGEVIGSEHIPIHILCKSHTCERLDQDNLLALSQIENKVELRQQIISREPRLRSFLGQSKCVTEVALAGLLKLVSQESDGKSVSLRDNFNKALEEAGIHKSLILYKEKRFTKLGYLAGAVYDCIPFFRQILNETPLNNLLVRSCRLYVENEFILAGFKALANFTYNVTMPFLNCVEKCDQEYLCTILPTLYEDLCNAKLNTLEAYKVEWTHVKMNQNVPTTDLDHYFLSQMCLAAAKGVKLQCSREYWEESDENVRATQIHKLSETERAYLPANNLVTERDLASFGYLASLSAKRSNRFFKAKRIQDDLMFWAGNDNNLVHKDHNTMKILDDMEASWDLSQKEKQKGKLQSNILKKIRSNNAVDALLIKCKEHGGPVTTMLDVHKLSDNKSYLRREIQYQRVTHPRDASERPELYKVNCLSSEEMVLNLSYMLNSESDETTPAVFLCEDEIMAILKEPQKETQSVLTIIELEQSVAVVWDEPNNKKNSGI